MSIQRNDERNHARTEMRFQDPGGGQILHPLPLVQLNPYKIHPVKDSRNRISVRARHINTGTTRYILRFGHMSTSTLSSRARQIHAYELCTSCHGHLPGNGVAVKLARHALRENVVVHSSNTLEVLRHTSSE